MVQLEKWIKFLKEVLVGVIVSVILFPVFLGIPFVTMLLISMIIGFLTGFLSRLEVLEKNDWHLEGTRTLL